MFEDVTTSDKDGLHVMVDQKYHFFRNESEISNESKVWHVGRELASTHLPIRTVH